MVIFTYISGQLDVSLKPHILVAKSNVQTGEDNLYKKLEHNLLELMSNKLEKILSAKTKEEEKEHTEFDLISLLNIILPLRTYHLEVKCGV